jgi:hypothetical protein
MNMLKHLKLFAFLLIAIYTKAQMPSLLLMSNDTLWKGKSMMALLNGDASIASNALDVDFMRKSLLGGHIEREHIDDLLKNMPEESRVGYAVNVQMELLNFRDTLFGKPNLGMRAALSTHYHGFLGFGPEAFETIYRGNATDAGMRTELGPLSLQSQSWQKFGFGIFNKTTLSGITLSLVEGQSFRSLNVEGASLYTSSLGDSLSVQLVGDYFRSDTTRNGWANGSGIGACIDFDYNLPLKDESGFVSLTVRNLGFAVWNDRSERYLVDTRLDWEGLYVNDWLSGEEDSLAMPQWGDSLNQGRTQLSVVQPLPVSIQMRYLRKWKGSHFWETGFSFSPNRAAVPLVYAGLSHAIGSGFWISERLSYGGYGGIALGFEVQWLSKHSWFLRAGSAQVEGWLLPMSGGRSAYFNVGKNF